MDDDFELSDLEDFGDEYGFEPARFKSQLKLPSAAAPILNEAATAVGREYRDSAKWKRLNCRKVDLVAERDRGTVVVLHVGTSVEFDWTWEGAIAFRPLALDGAAPVTNEDAQFAIYGDSAAWRGEILEFDETNGCLFLSLDHSTPVPTTGEFFVRPFEFLSVLDAVFNQAPFEDIRPELASRLAAAKGGIHPRITSLSPVSLPDLQTWWQHSWSILWGPPGTGKTYTTGQQIAAVLDDPFERILVVSTTNRATDAVAISLGQAARVKSADAARCLDDGGLLRIGKGASLPHFQNSGFEVMLQSSDADVLHQTSELTTQLKQLDEQDERAFVKKRIGELRSITGQNNSLFVDPRRRVVVATAFKAMTMLNDPMVKMLLSAQESPFTTIFIDEAGLISRAAVAALSLLAAKRVVLVGDSRQLAPISRVSRVLPKRQQCWLASSGLSHLKELIDTPPAVHVLWEQYRMHPDVCHVVSRYQYSGVLKTAQQTCERASTAPRSLAEFSRTLWYVLDEEEADLDTIRAERGAGNKSWIRPITPLILEKLFSDPAIRHANGLFVSPFKAQTQRIANWLAKHQVHTWEASTVHRQQGSEAALVVFDTVHAGNCVWPFEEWKRMINVALSRAKEGVILLASRSEMDEPYLRPLTKLLKPAVLVRSPDAHNVADEQRSADLLSGPWRWRSVPLKQDQTELGSTRLAEAPSHYQLESMGQQISSRKKMAPVPSREQQRLINQTLDGKPRLVRGVAGSGKSYVLCNWMAKIVRRMEANQESQIWAVYANRSLHKLLRDSIEVAWVNLYADQLFDPPPFPWELVSLLHIRDVLAQMLPEVELSMDRFEFDYDRAAEEYLNRRPPDDSFPRCTALFIDEAQDMGSSTLKLLLSLVEQTDRTDPNSRPAHIFYDNAQNLYGRPAPKWSEFGLDLRGRSTILKESFRSTKPITELAINVLNQLAPFDQNLEQLEGMKLNPWQPLEQNREQNQPPWLSSQFDQPDGPRPIFYLCDNREMEIDRIASHLKYLIQQEQIPPMEITILYIGEVVAETLQNQLAPPLRKLRIEISIQKNRPFDRRENTILVTTPHSFKGYESEVVLIPCVDQFVARDGQVLANGLYVAMTRARSLLAIYGSAPRTPSSQKITCAIERCIDRS